MDRQVFALLTQMLYVSYSVHSLSCLISFGGCLVELNRPQLNLTVLSSQMIVIKNGNKHVYDTARL